MTAQHVRVNRYQRGAETVEFMLTLLLFLFVFFMIIEFAVVTYDRGTLNNAARMGSRQASLYWADPICFDTLKPLENQRMKPLMVTSVMTWTDQNVLIDPASTGLNSVLQVNGANMTLDADCANGIDDVIVLPPDIVSVGIDHAYQSIGLAGFVSAFAPTLGSFSSAGVE